MDVLLNRDVFYTGVVEWHTMPIMAAQKWLDKYCTVQQIKHLHNLREVIGLGFECLLTRSGLVCGGGRKSIFSKTNITGKNMIVDFPDFTVFTEL